MLGRHPIARTITASLAALSGAMAATVAVTPEFREARGTDVIFDAPHLGVAGRLLLVAISIAAAALIVTALRSGDPSGGAPRITMEVITVSVGVGILAGVGYRIVTAKTSGANIGGGLILLASPIGALLFIGYLALRLRAMRLSGQG